MDLILRPFFLGGIMKETGNRPPMMVPSKALYMQKDLIRNSAYFDVPVKLIEVKRKIKKNYSYSANQSLAGSI